MNHPFHKKFLESLNIELEKFGVKIEDTKIDHFHNMFDIKKMKAMLFQYGFNLLIDHFPKAEYLQNLKIFNHISFGADKIKPKIN